MMHSDLIPTMRSGWSASSRLRISSTKAPNPFKGMSREQLSLITHDQDGSFTINERRAASAEAGAQEFEWAKYIIDKMDAERRSTGRSDQAMLETIAHYDSLPRIDVAAYGNYEAAIRNTMQMHEFEVQLPTVGTSLLEQLANEWGESDELPNSPLSGLATYSSAGMSAVLNDSAISTRDQSARVAVQQSPADLELSALAKQLHAAALRASARDGQLSRSELAELAARLNASLSGDNYAFAKDFYDAQMPTMQIPELLERARQATTFINGTGANPFLGMSRQQLSLIAYDEGSEFTFNERRAALWESSRQEAEWTRSVVGKMDIESQRTGRCTQGLKEIVSYYQSLPPIEEAQHGNYETQIARQASLEEIEWPEFRTSLIDLMANEWKIVDNPLDQQRPDASADAPAAQKA